MEFLDNCKTTKSSQSIIITILQCKPLEIYPYSSARNRNQAKSAGNSFFNINYIVTSNKIKKYYYRYIVFFAIFVCNH